MSDDLHIDGDFTLNIPHIEAEFTLNEQPDIQADFSIKLTPEKVSQLENDLNFQTETQVNEAIQAESDVINARIDTEVNTLNERIDDIQEGAITEIIGEGNISATQSGNTVTITSETYVFVQGIPSDTWVINHNLNKYPTVDLVDSSGRVFKSEVDYTDTNSLVVYINGSLSGKAYLN